MSEDKKSKKLLILSPLTGKVMPLEDVPDPVFSQKIIGDGVAVFPSEASSSHVQSPSNSSGNFAELHPQAVNAKLILTHSAINFFLIIRSR